MFEHCSIIWSPLNASQLLKFDSIQKRAVKWIYNEQFASYSAEVFRAKQKELGILPIRLKFIHNSVSLFYKIVNNLIDIDLPHYLTIVSPEAARFTRGTASVFDDNDKSTYSCAIAPKCNNFRNSFFYRTMLLWNAIPLNIRRINGVSNFKHELTTFLWSADTNWPD